MPERQRTTGDPRVTTLRSELCRLGSPVRLVPLPSSETPASAIITSGVKLGNGGISNIRSVSKVQAVLHAVSILCASIGSAQGSVPAVSTYLAGCTTSQRRGRRSEHRLLAPFLPDAISAPR